MSSPASSALADPGPVPSTPPPRHCDVIMKGGITSGVVYPAAGVELARRFTLKSIGGASAGAIAAAMFAAAEHRRSVLGSADGFVALEKLPGTLGGKTASGEPYLLALMRPSADARRLFRLLLAFLPRVQDERREARASDRVRTGLRVAGTAVVQYLGAFIVGLIPAAALVVFAWRAADTPAIRAGVLVLSVLPLLLGVSVPVIAAVFLDLVRATSRHQFGLCPGVGPAVSTDDPPPLTDWLERSVDAIALGAGGSPGASAARPEGLDPGDPLTFADLWGARTADDARRLAADAGGRRINLEVITTNLTQGRPYRLPFESETLYFRPAELRQLFSKRLVDYLERRGRALAGRGSILDEIAKRDGLVPLPSPAELPVVMAVRMSLSFPILISAVPLWGFDFSWAAKDASGERGEPKLSRCWFSDGGLTSNFPIHFFDGPIPRWPTFAFNLTPFHPRFTYDPKDETKNVWLPRTNGEGLTENWSNPPKRSGPMSQLVWFVGRIVDTMQNWRDNIQLKVPGYRDRIAQIHMRDEEGGLNLTMPDEVIRALSVRGAYAARVLAERFSDHPPAGTILTWDNHCWVRLRSLMSLLEQHVARIERAYAQREGTRTYAQIADHPPSYRYPDPAAARAMLAELDELAAGWARTPGALSAAAPRPSPELRILPRV